MITSEYFQSFTLNYSIVTPKLSWSDTLRISLNYFCVDEQIYPIHENNYTAKLFHKFTLNINTFLLLNHQNFTIK